MKELEARCKLQITNYKLQITGGEPVSALQQADGLSGQVKQVFAFRKQDVYEVGNITLVVLVQKHIHIH